METEDEKEELLQLLHRWLWLWNEGELSFEPLQLTQEDLDDLIVRTRTALIAPTQPHAPDAKLPPLVPDGPRRKMLIEIEVSANFEKRLDNQWEVEREINADRWSWSWPKDDEGRDRSHLAGRRISGPEVEFDEATERELHEQLDDIRRAQIASPDSHSKPL